MGWLGLCRGNAASLQSHTIHIASLFKRRIESVARTGSCVGLARWSDETQRLGVHPTRLCQWVGQSGWIC